jgi:hypothetical protein
MAVCATCGNDYDKCFELKLSTGETFLFDSFECAIERAAVACAHCGCRILGHGMEAHGAFYCCASCATKAGEVGLRDRKR